MPDRPWELRQIGQVRIEVTDVDRAVAFYRDVLGMAFLYAIPGMGFFDVDGVRIMLAEPEGRAFGGESAIYYRVGETKPTMMPATAATITATQLTPADFLRSRLPA